jgi:hypothetical protein
MSCARRKTMENKVPSPVPFSGTGEGWGGGRLHAVALELPEEARRGQIPRPLKA